MSFLFIMMHNQELTPIRSSHRYIILPVPHSNVCLYLGPYQMWYDEGSTMRDKVRREKESLQNYSSSGIRAWMVGRRVL